MTSAYFECNTKQRDNSPGLAVRVIDMISPLLVTRSYLRIPPEKDPQSKLHTHPD
jgi:hypothetical protein